MTEPSKRHQSFTLLNWTHVFQKSPFPLLKKGEIENLPFVKGDLEGFSSAQHHFDETLTEPCFGLTTPKIVSY